MLKNIIKNMIKISRLALVFAMSLTLSSCVKEYSAGYFKYKFQYGSKRDIMISGLTSLGLEQRFLVVPTEINGYEVKEVLNRLGYGYSNTYFTGGNLEKVFFYSNEIRKGSLIVDDNVKVIMLSVPESYQGENPTGGNPTVYIYYKIYNPSWKFIKVVPANVTYYINISAAVNYGLYWRDEAAVNYGIYWLDDVEEGELIEFIPPEPILEGYSFGGWFKEKECLNQWNYQTDTVDERLDLYAKWTNN